MNINFALLLSSAFLILSTFVTITSANHLYTYSCSSYYYTSYYSYYYSSRSIKCCRFKTGYSTYSYYKGYCPTKSVLSSICTGSSCCNARVPVAAYNTFYFYQYFCPDTSPTTQTTTTKTTTRSAYLPRYYYVSPVRSYCGFYCTSTASFATVGFCFCICGLAFSISFCIIVNFIVRKKKKNAGVVVHQTSYNPPQHSARQSTGLYDTANFKNQTLQSEASMSLPPAYPGYLPNTCDSYPGRVPTLETNPSPPQITGATAYPPQTTGATAYPPQTTGATAFPPQTTGATAYPPQATGATASPPQAIEATAYPQAIEDVIYLPPNAAVTVMDVQCQTTGDTP